MIQQIFVLSLGFIITCDNVAIYVHMAGNTGKKAKAMAYIRSGHKNKWSGNLNSTKWSLSGKVLGIGI